MHTNFKKIKSILDTAECSWSSGDRDYIIKNDTTIVRSILAVMSASYRPPSKFKVISSNHPGSEDAAQFMHMWVDVETLYQGADSDYYVEGYFVGRSDTEYMVTANIKDCKFKY